MEIDLSKKMINFSPETVVHTSQCVSTVWIFDSLRIQIKSKTHKVHTFVVEIEQDTSVFIVAVVIVVVVAAARVLFVWIIYCLDFGARIFGSGRQSVCCSFNWVDSIKMLWISNELHPYVCVWVAPTLSFADLTTDCTRSLRWNGIKRWCCSNPRLIQCVAIHSNQTVSMFGRGYFRSECDTQPFLVGVMRIVHTNATARRYIWYDSRSLLSSPFHACMCARSEHTNPKPCPLFRLHTQLRAYAFDDCTLFMFL